MASDMHTVKPDEHLGGRFQKGGISKKEGVAEDILVLWRIGDAQLGQEKSKATIVAVEQTTNNRLVALDAILGQ